jgi:hypothetical protein
MTGTVTRTCIVQLLPDRPRLRLPARAELGRPRERSLGESLRCQHWTLPFDSCHTGLRASAETLGAK